MKKPHLKIFIYRFILISVTTVLSSCGQLISNAKQEFAEDLAATIQQYDDPEIIKKAVPSYLILVSSMIRSDQDNPDLLESGAQLYAAYASGFTDSDESKRVLSKRALDYASNAICLRNENFCNIEEVSFFEFENRLKTVDQTQVNTLFVFVSSWAGYIEANSTDWNAIAELPKVEQGIFRVLELDETIQNGNVHVYMGVMESLLPPTLGGKPELAKKHFERAIEISKGTNLMAKVLYAEKYARLLFDRELHDELLNQVINTNIENSKNKLVDTLAKQKAKELLANANDYF